MTTRFASILVAVDGGPRDRAVIEQALALSRSNNASVTVICASDKLPERGLLLLPGLEKAALEQTREQLEELLGPYRKDGRVLPAKVVFGTPFIEIIREVLRSGHDLVMKTAETDDDAAIRGATDMQLIRKCPCPVWLVKPSQQSRAAGVMRVLVAVDPRHGDDTPELNQTLLNLSALLVSEKQGTVHVVHAYQDSLPTGLLARLGQSSNALFSKQVGDLAEEEVRRLVAASDIGSIHHEIHVLPGRPDEVIPQVAKEQGAQVIVMGTIGRAGIAGYFIGNTAERVLANVTTDVLAVEPAGFISPIRLVD